MGVFALGSLFAGTGGIDLAFQNAGFTVAWQCEIDEFCQQVLAKNFPESIKYRDIYECQNLPYVDVICAGFPCQPFSVAGKQQGRDDERFLVPEMLRIIHETQPSVVFLENVPGFASLNDGDEFKKLLRAFAQMGYDAQWGHIRASDIGAPHQRERWFCILTRQMPHTKSQRLEKGRELRPNQPTKRAGRSSSALPNPQRIRRGTGRINQPQVLRGNGIRRVVSSIREGYTLRHEPDAICGIRRTAKLGNTSRINSQGGRRIWEQLSPAYARQTLPRGASRRGKQNPLSQSRLGRNTDGLSCGMDRPIAYDITRHQFPAHRNMPQHDFEPSRTTDRKDLRRDRLKALGNAVVPQTVYPIAIEIYDFLDRKQD